MDPRESIRYDAASRESIGGAGAQGYEDLYRDTSDNLSCVATHVKLVRALTLVQLGLARGSDELPVGPGISAAQFVPDVVTSTPVSGATYSSPHPGAGAPVGMETPVIDIGPGGVDGGMVPGAVYADGTNGLGLAMGSQLRDSEYASLVELLASALRDLTGGGPRSHAPGDQSPGFAPGPPGYGRGGGADARCFDNSNFSGTGSGAHNESLPFAERRERAKSKLLKSRPRLLRRRHSLDSPSLAALDARDAATSATAEDGTGTPPGLFSLLHTNLRLMARILRSPAIPDAQFDYPDAPDARYSPARDQLPLPGTLGATSSPGMEKRETDDIVEPSAVALGKRPAVNKKNSPLLRLPPELQRRIFREARLLSEDASAWLPSEKPTEENTRAGAAGAGRSQRRRNITPATSHHLGNGQAGFQTTGIVYNLPNSHDPYALDLGPILPAVPTKPKGGRRVAQEYAHSLALVCMDLLEVARSSAWETVHIRTRRQVQALVTLWRGEFNDYDEDEQTEKAGKGAAKGREGRAGCGRRGAGAIIRPDAWVLEDYSPMSSVASFDSYGVLDSKTPTGAPPQQDASGSSGGKQEEAGDGDGEKPAEGESSDDVRMEERKDSVAKVEDRLRKDHRRADLKTAGTSVRRMNIEVPAATGDSDKDKDASRRPPRRNRRRRNVYHQGLRTAPDLAASLAELQQSRKAAAEAESQQLPKLFSLTPHLQELVLCINPARGTTPYAHGGLTGHGFMFETIGYEVLDALCSLKSLRSLTLKSGIDFSDLEVLLPCLNALTELRLEGGLDSIDGRGDVDPELHHRCRLKTFTLQNLDFDGPDVSSDQLCWILGSSVGYLEHLDLIVSAGGGAGHAQWINGGAVGAASPAFGYRNFADLLVELGPTLRHLALRDCSTFGTVANDLNQAPHSGFLDYALLHCSRLQHLAIEWFVTGPALLDCIVADRNALASPDAETVGSSSVSATPSTSSSTASPSTAQTLGGLDLSKPRPLHTLTFFGSPERTSARTLQTAIGDPSKLPALRSVTLAAFPSQRTGQPVPWATRDLRKLREVCTARGVWLGFA